MTMHFEDFNNTEKISYMDDKLDTSDAVTEYAPEAGSFAYYIPWEICHCFMRTSVSPQDLQSLEMLKKVLNILKIWINTSQ